APESLILPYPVQQPARSGHVARFKAGERFLAQHIEITTRVQYPELAVLAHHVEDHVAGAVNSKALRRDAITNRIVALCGHLHGGEREVEDDVSRESEPGEHELDSNGRLLQFLLRL